jgi:hypothetical protein
MSVRLTVRMELLSFHWMGFHEICYFSVFQKSDEKIQESLKSDNNDRSFIWKRVHFYDHILLNYS